MTRLILLLPCVLIAQFALQFSFSDLLDPDGYYHLKMACVVRAQGPLVEFPWLPRTLLSPDRFSDHHWLFHVLLAPFCAGDTLAETVLWGKAAASIAASAAFVAMWIALRSQNVSHAFVLACIAWFASSPAFLVRMAMLRTQSLALAFLIVGLTFALRRRLVWVAITGTIFGTLYGGAFLLPVLLAIHALVVWLGEPERRARSFAAFGAGVAGWGLSYLISPYFPKNLRFDWAHVGSKLSPPPVLVGTEWSAADGPFFWGALVGPTVVFCMALLLGKRGARNRTVLWTFLGCAGLFLALTLYSRRFIEYFAPFAGLSLAFAWSLMSPMRKALRNVGLIAALIWSTVVVWRFTDNARSTPKFARYAPSATWLAAHAPRDALVANLNYAAFPLLLYYGGKQRYLVGLDPILLYESDSDSYLAWKALAFSERPDAAVKILEHLGSEWIVADRAEVAVDALLRGSAGRLKVAFEHAGVVVLRIK